MTEGTAQTLEFMLFLPETLLTSIKEHQTTSVGQPLSKQLYIKIQCLFANHPYIGVDVYKEFV